MQQAMYDYVAWCALGALCAMLTHMANVVTFKRVGGLLFWRVGRIGGSFYVAKGAR